MPAAIDFYFDFGSPFSYFALEKLKVIGPQYGRAVKLKPIILWPILRQIGNPPPLQEGPKGSYLLHDMQRSARFYGVKYNQPGEFSGSTHLAARAWHGLAAHDEDQANRFADQVFRVFFVESRDFKTPEIITEIGARVGASADQMAEAMSGETAKAALQACVTEALERGVYGAPFTFIDDEPFFGADRLDQMEAWLKTGGF